MFFFTICTICSHEERDSLHNTIGEGSGEGKGMGKGDRHFLVLVQDKQKQNLAKIGTMLHKQPGLFRVFYSSTDQRYNCILVHEYLK